jgi:hypothetical protein
MPPIDASTVQDIHKTVDRPQNKGEISNEATEFSQQTELILQLVPKEVYEWLHAVIPSASCARKTSQRHWLVVLQRRKIPQVDDHAWVILLGPWSTYVCDALVDDWNS